MSRPAKRCTLALALTCCAWAAAAATTACPEPSDLVPAHLWGLWQASFDDGSRASVLFEKHPESSESVRGAINRDSAQSLLAGDVDNGVLALDESTDGLHISAVWSGNVVPTSCGKEFKGLWRRSKDNQEHGFVLRKLPGWQ